MQNVDDENFYQIKVLKLKAAIINQEILNITSQLADSSTYPEDELDDSSACDAVYSIGMLLKENKSVKKSISELKKMNEELIENNRFLRAKTNERVPTLSYVSAAKTNSELHKIQKCNSETTTIIVTPEQSQSQEDTFAALKKSLIATKKPVNKVTKGKKAL